MDTLSKGEVLKNNVKHGKHVCLNVYGCSSGTVWKKMDPLDKQISNSIWLPVFDPDTNMLVSMTKTHRCKCENKYPHVSSVVG